MFNHVFNQKFNYVSNQKSNQGFNKDIDKENIIRITQKNGGDILEKYCRGEITRDEFRSFFIARERGGEKFGKFRFEVEGVILPISDISRFDIEEEHKEEYKVDFSGFILSGCSLELKELRVDLNNAILNNCILEGDVNNIEMSNTRFYDCEIVNKDWRKFNFEKGMFYGCRFYTRDSHEDLCDFSIFLENDLKNMRRGGRKFIYEEDKIYYLELVTKYLKENPKTSFLTGVVNSFKWNILESYQRKYGTEATGYLILANLGIINENIKNWSELEKLFRNGAILENVRNVREENEIKIQNQIHNIIEDYRNGKTDKEEFWHKLNKFRNEEGLLMLIDTDLSFIDFSGLSLDKVVLNASNLSMSNFSECTINNCDFYNTKIDNTNFSMSKISNTNFNVDSSDSNFSRVEFSNVDLEKGVFCNGNFEGAKFNCCNCIKSDFYNTTMRNVIFNQVNASGANFTSSNLEGFKIENSVFMDLINGEKAIFEDLKGKSPMIEKLIKELEEEDNKNENIEINDNYLVANLNKDYSERYENKEVSFEN